MDTDDQSYGGRYRILDRLGAGFRQDMLAVRRFRREAELGARLSHPNVVAVLDAGAEPHPFIVMELVRGPNAAVLAKGQGQQPLAAALRAPLVSRDGQAR